MEDGMTNGRVSHLREVEAKILDARSYVDIVNALGRGTYCLLDGTRFPEYVEIGKENVASGRTAELPELALPKDTWHFEILAVLVRQISPFLEKDEADIYIQRVKQE